MPRSMFGIEATRAATKGREYVSIVPVLACSVRSIYTRPNLVADYLLLFEQTRGDVKECLLKFISGGFDGIYRALQSVSKTPGRTPVA